MCNIYLTKCTNCNTCEYDSTECSDISASCQQIIRCKTLCKRCSELDSGAIDLTILRSMLQRLLGEKRDNSLSLATASASAASGGDIKDDGESVDESESGVTVYSTPREHSPTGNLFAFPIPNVDIEQIEGESELFPKPLNIGRITGLRPPNRGDVNSANTGTYAHLPPMSPLWTTNIDMTASTPSDSFFFASEIGPEETDDEDEAPAPAQPVRGAVPGIIGRYLHLLPMSLLWSTNINMSVSTPSDCFHFTSERSEPSPSPSHETLHRFNASGLEILLPLTYNPNADGSPFIPPIFRPVSPIQHGHFRNFSQVVSHDPDVPRRGQTPPPSPAFSLVEFVLPLRMRRGATTLTSYARTVRSYATECSTVLPSSNALRNFELMPAQRRRGGIDVETSWLDLDEENEVADEDEQADDLIDAFIASLLNAPPPPPLRRSNTRPTHSNIRLIVTPSSSGTDGDGKDPFNNPLAEMRTTATSTSYDSGSSGEAYVYMHQNSNIHGFPYAVRLSPQVLRRANSGFSRRKLQKRSRFSQTWKQKQAREEVKEVSGAQRVKAKVRRAWRGLKTCFSGRN